MTTDTPLETRQINSKWIRNFASLSRTATDPDVYYHEFVTGVWRYLAALGSALWLPDNRDFKVRSSVGLSVASLQSLLNPKHQQVIEQAFAHNDGFLLPPQEELKSSARLQNPAGTLLLLGPIRRGGRATAIIEILQRTGSPPHVRRGYLRFLLQMCELASESRLFGK